MIEYTEILDAIVWNFSHRVWSPEDHYIVSRYSRLLHYVLSAK